MCHGLISGASLNVIGKRQREAMRNLECEEKQLPGEVNVICEAVKPPVQNLTQPLCSALRMGVVMMPVCQGRRKECCSWLPLPTSEVEDIFSIRIASFKF